MFVYSKWRHLANDMLLLMDFIIVLLCGGSVYFDLFISHNLPGYSPLFVAYLALWVDLCSVYNIAVWLIE